jgi:hypothetical protein
MSWLIKKGLYKNGIASEGDGKGDFLKDEPPYYVTQILEGNALC